MSVTFGTVVKSNMSTRTTIPLAMSGVTDGQPIFLFVVGWVSNTPSVADTFSSAYTWTAVEHGTGGGTTIWLYIGTGGSGTSGTVTATVPSNNWGGLVVPCIGASTASGLTALDAHGNNSGNSTTVNSPSLTPTASGEGAIYGFGGVINNTSPSSPWTATNISTSGSNQGGVATDPSPTSGVALSTSWGVASAAPWFTVGAIIKAAAAGGQVAGTLNLLLDDTIRVDSGIRLTLGTGN